MFALDQATGQFLWARPFPYDDPNINMNGIDVKTGQNADQFRQGVQEGRRSHHRLLSQHARDHADLPITRRTIRSTCRSTINACR